ACAAVLALAAACAPGIEKIPCTDDQNCPSNTHCIAGKCVSGDAPPRVAWTSPDGATPLAGTQTFSCTVDHPDGVSLVKLLSGSTELGSVTEPAGFGLAPTKVDFSVDTATKLTDGSVDLNCKATNVHGLESSDLKRSFTIDN